VKPGHVSIGLLGGLFLFIGAIVAAIIGTIIGAGILMSKGAKAMNKALEEKPSAPTPVAIPDIATFQHNGLTFHLKKVDGAFFVSQPGSTDQEWKTGIPVKNMTEAKRLAHATFQA